MSVSSKMGLWLFIIFSKSLFKISYLTKDPSRVACRGGEEIYTPRLRQRETGSKNLDFLDNKFLFCKKR